MAFKQDRMFWLAQPAQSGFESASRQLLMQVPSVQASVQLVVEAEQAVPLKAGRISKAQVPVPESRGGGRLESRGAPVSISAMAPESRGGGVLESV